MKPIHYKTKLIACAIILLPILLTGISSCKMSCHHATAEQISTVSNPVITEQEVEDMKKLWGEGLVKIGKTYKENGDYKAVATEHVTNLYNYQEGKVLFKPTIAYQKQFRTEFEGALSYFIGGDSKYPEDKGFALKKWSSVRWETIGTHIKENLAITMGNLYLTPENGGDELKVEYSFVFIKNTDGKLKILLQDYHLPYSPDKK